MPNYIRYIEPGHPIFLTLVTYQRKSLLIDNRRLLHDAMCYTRKRWPFVIHAMVLMPDHLHAIIQLPNADSNLGVRVKLIKSYVSRHSNELGGWHQSRFKRRECAFWQRRYWSHVIVNEQDYKHHFDYIHYNPVKHGYVNQVSDWPYSSFHRHIRGGVYQPGWGSGEKPPVSLQSFCANE